MIKIRRHVLVSCLHTVKHFIKYKGTIKILKSKNFLHGFSHISNNETNVEKCYNIVVRSTAC